MPTNDLKTILRSEDETLFHKLMIIEETSKTFWSKGEIFHPYFTLHGYNHSQRIIEIINKLTEKFMESDFRLNAYEIFCLLSAALLHDVGMLITKKKDENSQFIRKQHHLRTWEFIIEKKDKLYLNHFESNIIAQLCKGHRCVDLKSSDFDDQIIQTYYIRVRLLAALMRLGDELDIDYRRAPEALKQILQIQMPTSSKIHWLKHYYVQGLMFGWESRYGLNILTISISTVFPENEKNDAEISKLIVEPVLQGITSTSEILNRYGIVIELKELKINRSKSIEEIPEEITDEIRKPEIEERKQTAKKISSDYITKYKDLIDKIMNCINQIDAIDWQIENQYYDDWDNKRIGRKIANINDNLFDKIIIHTTLSKEIILSHGYNYLKGIKISSGNTIELTFSPQPNGVNINDLQKKVILDVFKKHQSLIADSFNFFKLRVLEFNIIEFIDLEFIKLRFIIKTKLNIDNRGLIKILCVISNITDFLTNFAMEISSGVEIIADQELERRKEKMEMEDTDEKLKIMWDEMKETKETHKKGRLLEDFIVTLLQESKDFDILGRNIRSDFEEIDIMCTHKLQGIFKELGSVLLIECKNWSKKVDKNELVIFFDKVSSRKPFSNMGIFISVRGFTTAVKDFLKSKSQSDIRILLISGNDIDEMFNKNRNFSFLIKDKFTKNILLMKESI